MVEKSNVVMLILGGIIILLGGHVFRSNFRSSFSLEGGSQGSIIWMIGGGALMLVGLSVYLVFYTKIRGE